MTQNETCEAATNRRYRLMAKYLRAMRNLVGNPYGTPAGNIYLTHFIQDTILVVSDIFGNNLINTGNIDTYFTESSSVGPNNHFFLNLSLQIQEKLT